MTVARAVKVMGTHTEKSFRNLIESIWNQIVVTIFQLIWIQADLSLDPNQSGNGNSNLISDWFNKISLSLAGHYVDQFLAPSKGDEGGGTLIDLTHFYPPFHFRN